MRVTVADVLELLAAGMSTDAILEDYPYLERDDITACLEYAVRQVKHEAVTHGRDAA